MTGHEHDVEIVISDNASTDDTGDSVRTFQETHPWIRYHRNEITIRGENNFRLVASLALGENVWVFGDDDKMEAVAISRVLANIRNGFELTVCNYSTWNKQFSALFKKNGLNGALDVSIVDPNVLLKRFGLHLGFISCVVMKKVLFLKLPIEEYERYAEYGFPFVYAVYTGVANDSCKVGFIADPIVLNRAGNSGDYDWYKYFVTGSSLIFDELLHNGYTKSAVRAAKYQVLMDFVIPSALSFKIRRNVEENKQIMRLLLKHYKRYWQFWVCCFPRLLAPVCLLRPAKKILLFIRHIRGIKA
jgi:glycosyltransferase involved in cell wall biosynthesis